MMEKIFSPFTDKEGNPEMASILGFIAFMAFIYFGFHYYIELGKDFDPLAFGTGAGGLAVGHGAGKMMSNKGDYGS